MGKLADLVNMPMQQLRYHDGLGSDFEVSDGQKINSEKERHEVIQQYCLTSGDTVDLWATLNFSITWNHKEWKIKEGKNSVSPVLAIFLLIKYGIDNHYGNLAKYNGWYIHDEPVFVAEQRRGGPKKFNFSSKKPAKTDEKQ